MGLIRLPKIALFLVLAAPAFAQSEPEGSGVEPTEAVQPDATAEPAAADDAAPAEEEAADAEADAAETTAPAAASNTATTPRPDGLIPPPALPEQQRGAFSQFEEALRLYEAEIADYQRTIQEIVQVEYSRERERRLAFYNDNIELLRIEERERRDEAIADFERFLERFPNHPDYSADVLFRLAELHYEKSVDEYNQADANFELALERYELGIEPDRPETPEKDFRNTISLFRRLIANYPDYRQLDGAFYLTGICYEQMDEYELGLQAYQELVTRYPESDFAQEGYLRIGEFYFEEAAFVEAREAYDSALRYGESRWYDKILFKLGWANYLLGEYDPAIQQFTMLLEYYEQKEESAAALEEEALQYFAFSISEEDWDLDAERDPDFLMPRVMNYLGEDRGYTGKVLDRLAGILLEDQRFEYSVEINRHAIARFECDPANLDRALQIVEALGQMRAFDEARAMQRELSTQFGPGSEWYSCMERLGETDAITQAERVVRDNLVETAARYYNDAQELREEALAMGDDGLLAESKEQFSFAANIYADFIEQYPDDELTYEMSMYHGQALLFAARYEEAAAQFGVVRDSPLDDQFQELAAALSIQSYEYALQEAIDSFELEGRAWPAYSGVNEYVAEAEPDEDPEAPRSAPTVAEPVPELSLAWAAAIDRYLAMGLNSEDDPRTAFRYGFQVGKLFYDYKNYDAAEERFLIVLDRCDPQAPESGYAAGFMLNIYQQRRDSDAVVAFREALGSRYSACIDPETRTVLAADVRMMVGGIIAQSAEELFEAGQFEEAAEEYARLAAEYADNEEFAPVGLFNSGLIYEQQLRKYEDAIVQFDRLIAEYPDSDYVDDAHVRIAVNAKRFFDFDRAIDEFLILDGIGFSDPDLVEHPILDAALLMESVGRKREAAEAYLDWARSHPNDERAASAMFTAATLYDDMGDHRTMRTIFEDFRDDYGRSMSDLIDIDAAVIDSYYRTAVAYEEDGDTRDANRAYDNIVSEFSLRLPESIAAKYAAAKVIYDRAMGSFANWNNIELGESVREQQEGLQDRRDGLEPLVLEFREVVDFGSAEWTVCAFYMEGRVFQVMADLLYALPLPDFGGDFDAEDAYVLMVEDFAQQYEDQAIAAWEVAYPIMQQLGVTNQCTVDMTAQLNRYRGAQYPVFRTAIEYEETQIFSPPGFRVPPTPEAPPAGMIVPADSADPFGGVDP